MSTDDTYTLFPVFQGAPGVIDPSDADETIHEVELLLKEHADRVTVRGTYSSVGFRADADLLWWWVANTPEALQDLLVGFRRTVLGQVLEPTWMFMGVHRPPEVAKDHVPAFIRGDEPKRYLNVYPFVRTADWYLLPGDERAQHLREHGMLGREFPGILANTTSAFGLNDWEWILAFEADDLTELVDCIRRLRDSEARRFTKEEVPFVTGIRKDLADVVRDII